MRYNGPVLVNFWKMHGLGNDFVVIDALSNMDGLTDSIPTAVLELTDLLTALSPSICDRHFGIGADGLIIVQPSRIADFKMHYVNADGSLSPMCGNGVRCVGKFIHDSRLADVNPLMIETGAGVVELALAVMDDSVKGVTVDMGIPNFSTEYLPADFEGSRIVEERIDFGGEALYVTCLSVGNPHCVHFIESAISVQDYPVGRVGRKIENFTNLFPKRINAEFAKVLARDRIELRVWERGCGETLACGSGACATVAAGIATGRVDLGVPVAVQLPGGTLEISWSGKPDEGIKMFGPAETVFIGEFDTEHFE